MSRIEIAHADCLELLRGLPDDSVSLLLTDPPYGYSFMGKDWDRAVPPVAVWAECLRVLKPGAFAFVMSAPRSDVQRHMIGNLEDAGFNVAFTPVYWTYATGFPKAANIGKLVDKRRADNTRDVCRYIRAAMDAKGLKSRDISDAFGFHPRMVDHWAARDTDSQPAVPKWDQWMKLKELLDIDDPAMEAMVWRQDGREGQPGEAWAEREVVGQGQCGDPAAWYAGGESASMSYDITAPATDAALALDGSYAGFQPKPAVEVVIVAMKPLSKKTYVEQALDNGHGVTWLDGCRIPCASAGDRAAAAAAARRFLDDGKGRQEGWRLNDGPDSLAGYGDKIEAGRFPANLLVSDGVLDDGKVRRAGPAGPGSRSGGIWAESTGKPAGQQHGDAGGYSRYFSLDAWAAERLPECVTFPFLVVPKAGKREKDAGLTEDGTLDARLGNGLSRVCSECGAGILTPCDCQGNRWVHPVRKNTHPTVKPIQLMSWLVTLGSRPGDLVLDPYAGSGTTACACALLDRDFVGSELEADSHAIAIARSAHWQGVRDAEQPTLFDGEAT